jgi:Tfp pilus assembly protein PilN
VKKNPKQLTPSSLPPPGGSKGGLSSSPLQGAKRQTPHFPPSGGTKGGLRISFTNHHYMVVSKNKKGKWSVIYTGSSLPWYYKYLTPLLVNTSAGSAPFVIKVVNEDHNETDTDINLPGFPPEKVHSAQVSINNQHISATTTDNALQTALSTVPSGCIVQSIKPPLWDLATLYSNYISSPFILWKFNNRDSIACYAENGVVTNNLTCWIGSDDLKENSKDTTREIEKFCKALCGQEKLVPVLCYPEIPTFSDSEIIHIPTIPAPAIENLSISEHELFAIATADTEQMNVLPYEHSVKVKNLQKTLKVAHTVSQWVLTAVACLLLVILSSIAFQQISQHYMSGSLHELNDLRTNYTIEKNRFDSLKSVFTKNAQHIQKESLITTLLNDIQNVFPEGMWAEEITIVESDKSMWKLTIRALSNSSELLPTFNNNLKKVHGTSNHRIIYSENTTLKNKPTSIIRTKVECNWNFQTP